MTLRAPLLALCVAAVAAPAAAQDAPAPSLEVRTDPEIPYHRLGVSADPLAVFFGEYGVRFEGTVGAAHSLFVEPAYLYADQTHAIGIEGGYHLWPLGAGLSGLFAGAAFGAYVTTGRVLTTTASLEVGYQHVWDGLVLGAGAGVTAAHTSGQGRWSLFPRVVLSLGYAWM